MAFNLSDIPGLSFLNRFRRANQYGDLDAMNAQALGILQNPALTEADWSSAADTLTHVYTARSVQLAASAGRHLTHAEARLKTISKQNILERYARERAHAALRDSRPNTF